MSDRVEKIHRFIFGEMPEDEFLEFQKQILQDESLQKEVEVYQKISEGMTQKFRHQKPVNDFKNTLQAVQADFFAKPEPAPAKVVPLRKNNWRRIASVAAAVVLLPIALWMFLPQGDLYQDYANYPPAQFVDKITDQSDAELLADAEQFFNDKKYADALTSLNAFLEKNLPASRQVTENVADKKLFQALCLIETNQIDQAKSTLKSLENVQDDFLKNDVNYYLGLLYLKEKNWNTATEYLKKIPTSSARSNTAQQIIDKIKNK